MINVLHPKVNFRNTFIRYDPEIIDDLLAKFSQENEQIRYI